MKLSNTPTTTAKLINTSTRGMRSTSRSALPESSGLDSDGSCEYRDLCTPLLFQCDPFTPCFVSMWPIYPSVLFHCDWFFQTAVSIWLNYLTILCILDTFTAMLFQCDSLKLPVYNWNIIDVLDCFTLTHVYNVFLNLCFTLTHVAFYYGLITHCVFNSFIYANIYPRTR